MCFVEKLLFYFGHTLRNFDTIEWMNPCYVAYEQAGKKENAKDTDGSCNFNRNQFVLVQHSQVQRAKDE